LHPAVSLSDFTSSHRQIAQRSLFVLLSKQVNSSNRLGTYPELIHNCRPTLTSTSSHKLPYRTIRILCLVQSFPCFHPLVASSFRFLVSPLHIVTPTIAQRRRTHPPWVLISGPPWWKLFPEKNLKESPLRTVAEPDIKQSLCDLKTFNIPNPLLNTSSCIPLLPVVCLCSSFAMQSSGLVECTVFSFIL
jgi:hypothetical protein